jgi:hypothetical protein
VFADLGLAPLVLIFLAAAVTVWVAGILLRYFSQPSASVV